MAEAKATIQFTGDDAGTKKTVSALEGLLRLAKEMQRRLVEEGKS